MRHPIITGESGIGKARARRGLPRNNMIGRIMIRSPRYDSPEIYSTKIKCPAASNGVS
jgi:hypothetical protein